MLHHVRSLGLSGVSGYEVTAECDLSGGLPAFDIVGLPDAAVKEARERNARGKTRKKLEQVAISHLLEIFYFVPNSLSPASPRPGTI